MLKLHESFIMSLVLCFKGTILVARTVLLTVRYFVILGSINMICKIISLKADRKTLYE
jgi:hypothetical protein